jgi:DNA-binding CsgD family transcriptional regulator/PAS domain-containing protein
VQPEADYDALVGALYAGPLEPVPWRAFLGLLRDALSAFAVTMILRPPRAGDTGLVHNAGGAQKWESAYAQRFFALDPFVDLPLGRVVRLSEMMADEALEASAFYTEFMRPAGVFRVVGFDVREPDGLEARLRVSRAREAGDFDGADAALLSRLAPHALRALQIHARLTRVESERDVFAGAVNQLALGAVLLDEQGRVLRASAAAEALLAAGCGLLRSGERLTASNPQDAAALRDAIARAQGGRGSERPALVQALRVRRADGDGFLALLVRPLPPSQSAEGSQAPALALFFGEPGSAGGLSPDALRELFGLTPAEALLATRLADGLSLDDAADALGIARNTARAHLRSVFAKTGATRQAELVRLVLRSVAALA